MENNLALTKYSGFGSVGEKKLTNIKMSKLSDSYGEARFGYSIVNYQNEALVVTGGVCDELLNLVCKFDMLVRYRLIYHQ